MTMKETKEPVFHFRLAKFKTLSNYVEIRKLLSEKEWDGAMLEQDGWDISFTQDDDGSYMFTYNEPNFYPNEGETIVKQLRKGECISFYQGDVDCDHDGQDRDGYEYSLTISWRQDS